MFCFGIFFRFEPKVRIEREARDSHILSGIPKPKKAPTESYFDIIILANLKVCRKYRSHSKIMIRKKKESIPPYAKDRHDIRHLQWAKKQQEKRQTKESFLVGCILILFFSVVFGIWACSHIFSNNAKKAQHDECLARAPYFAYKVEGEYASCERVLYASKEECIADGREKTITSPESGEPYHIYCNDDGTWSSQWTGRGKYDDADILARPEGSRYYCENVTSYNYDWQDDMYCTAPDGTHFYTSYEGANYYENL